jgi:hypothetical protein
MPSSLAGRIHFYLPPPATCICLIVLLGGFEKGGQAGIGEMPRIGGGLVSKPGEAGLRALFGES